MASERKSIIAHEWDMEAGVITFTVAGAGTCQLDLNATSEDTRQRALYHGFTQRVQDKAALARNPANGRSATPADKLEAMSKLCEHLNAGGEWEMRAAKAPSLNRAALFEAVAEVRGRQASEVAARFQDRPDEVLRAFLQVGEIAAAYAARVAKGSAVAEALLAELGGEGQ